MQANVRELVHCKLKELELLESKTGLVISGYPRNEQQYLDFKVMVNIAKATVVPSCSYIIR